MSVHIAGCFEVTICLCTDLYEHPKSFNNKLVAVHSSATYHCPYVTPSHDCPNVAFTASPPQSTCSSIEMLCMFF